VVVLIAALAACSPAQPQVQSQPSPAAAVAQFRSDELSFDYPGNWQAASFLVDSSFSHVFVYLSTEALSDPCDRTSSSIACSRSPIDSLGPNGILAQWIARSFPGWTFDPGRGQQIAVDGRTGTFERLDPTVECRAIGGELELVATIPSPVQWNWTEFRACVRGPALDALQTQVEDLLGGTKLNR
jgi:hypothetical protein